MYIFFRKLYILILCPFLIGLFAISGIELYDLFLEYFTGSKQLILNLIIGEMLLSNIINKQASQDLA